MPETDLTKWAHSVRGLVDPYVAKAIERLQQSLNALSARMDGLASKWGSDQTDLSDLRQELQAGGSAALNVQGLLGILAQPQIGGAPTLSAAPALSDPIVQDGSLYVLSGSPNILYRVNGSQDPPTFDLIGGTGSVTSVGSGTGLTGGPITTTGTLSLANTAVTPGSYTNSNVTVDAQGRITTASNGSGTGDVVGPASAVANNIAVFNGTTGKLIKDGGATVASLAPLASPTFTTQITTPLVIGGTSTTSPLTLRSTSGIGATGADIILQTGNNGATEVARLLNAGHVGIGTATPTTLQGGYSPLGGRVMSLMNAAGLVQLILSSTSTGSFLSYEVGDGTAGRRVAQSFYDGANNLLKFRFISESTAAVVQDNALVITNTGNVGVGTPTFGTSAVKVLALFNGTAPSTSPADTVQLFSTDLSAGNATLGLRTETAVVSEAVVSNATLSIVINGTTYKVLLKT